MTNTSRRWPVSVIVTAILTIDHWLRKYNGARLYLRNLDELRHRTTLRVCAQCPRVPGQICQALVFKNGLWGISSTGKSLRLKILMGRRTASRLSIRLSFVFNNLHASRGGRGGCLRTSASSSSARVQTAVGLDRNASCIGLLRPRSRLGYAATDAPTADSISFISACESEISAAFMFSSR